MPFLDDGTKVDADDLHCSFTDSCAEPEPTAGSAAACAGIGAVINHPGDASDCCSGYLDSDSRCAVDITGGPSGAMATNTASGTMGVAVSASNANNSVYNPATANNAVITAASFSPITTFAPRPTTVKTTCGAGKEPQITVTGEAACKSRHANDYDLVECDSGSFPVAWKGGMFGAFKGFFCQTGDPTSYTGNGRSRSSAAASRPLSRPASPPRAGGFGGGLGGRAAAALGASQPASQSCKSGGQISSDFSSADANKCCSGRTSVWFCTAATAASQPASQPASQSLLASGTYVGQNDQARCSSGHWRHGKCCEADGANVGRGFANKCCSGVERDGLCASCAPVGQYVGPMGNDKCCSGIERNYYCASS